MDDPGIQYQEFTAEDESTFEADAVKDRFRFITTIDIYIRYYSDEACEPDVNSLEDAGPEIPAHPITEGNEESTLLPQKIEIPHGHRSLE